MRANHSISSLWLALPHTEIQPGKRIKRQPEPLPCQEGGSIISMSFLTDLSLALQCLPAAEMPPVPQLVCSQFSQSFSTDKFLLT